LKYIKSIDYILSESWHKSVPTAISGMMDWFCIGGIQNVQKRQIKQLSTIPQSIYFPETKEISDDVTIDELDTLAIDNDCIITDLEFDCDDKLPAYESVEMKLRKVLHFDEHNSNKKVGYLKSVLESRAEELVLEGVKEDFDAIVLDDVVIGDTESQINVGYNENDDIFTIQSEELLSSSISEPECSSNATGSGCTC